MSNQFDTVLENRLAKIKDILGEKAKQYQRNDDRYHNFNKAAQFMGIEPEQALWGFVMKHIAALNDYQGDLPGKCMSREQWNEKIGDIINYLILLEGMIDLRVPAQTPKEIFEQELEMDLNTPIAEGCQTATLEK